METILYHSKVNDVITNHLNNNTPPATGKPGDDLRMQRLVTKWFDTNNRTLDTRAVALDAFISRLQNPKSPAQFYHALHAYQILGEQTNTATYGRIILATKALLAKWFSSYEPELDAEVSYFGNGANADCEAGSEINKLLSGDWPVAHHRQRAMLRRIAKRNRVMRGRCIMAGEVLTRNASVALSKNTLFEIGFHHLTKRRVYDRVTTVPKNNKTDRTIAMAPRGTQVVESAVAFGIERCLEQAGCFLRNSKRTGYDGQHYHGKIISDPSVATIDFSAASDSNYWWVVKFLFSGTPLEKDLNLVRVRVLEIEGTLYHSPIFASMGRRVCFLVMTAVLAALSCAICGCGMVNRMDSQSPQVYGDDVIIPNCYAPRFINVANILGYNVNESKTFINSKFRESCGAFFHDDYGYLKSFEMKPATNTAEAVSLVNKAFLNYIESSCETQGFWYDLWQKTFEIFAGSLRGPIPRVPEEALGLWLFDPEFSKPKSNSQTDWLSARIGTEVFSIDTIGYEVADQPVLKGSVGFFHYILSVRDGKSCPVVDGLHSVKENRRRLVIDADGHQYGTFENLRALRSEEVRRTTYWEIYRFLRSLRVPDRLIPWLCTSSWDLTRVRMRLC